MKIPKKLTKQQINMLAIFTANIILIIVVLYFAVILKDYIRVMDLNPCDICFDRMFAGYGMR